MTSKSGNSNFENQSTSFPLSLHDSLNDCNQTNMSAVIHWINSFEFTRPKRSISRDFSDATMVAEILKLYWPKLIDLHNYAPASSLANKISNWETLNRKVLKKLKISLSKSTIEKLSIADANAVCRLLKSLKTLVDKHENEKQLELENSKKHPVYVIVDEDMVQLADNECNHIKGLDKDVVRLIHKLKQKVNDMEHKIENLSSLMYVKDRRINDLQTQLNKMKKCNDN